MNELGVRNTLVGGEERVMEGLGGVSSGEMARLGDGEEELLHRVAVNVELVNGLERLVLPLGVRVVVSVQW